MIETALTQITTVSTDDEINTENFIDSLQYMDRLDPVILVLQRYFKPEELFFMPTFLSNNIKNINRESNYSNNLSIFIIRCVSFEDKEIRKKIRSDIKKIYKNATISFDKDELKINLE